jgi:hypothetical protein
MLLSGEEYDELESEAGGCSALFGPKMKELGRDVG